MEKPVAKATGFFMSAVRGSSRTVDRSAAALPSGQGCGQTIVPRRPSRRARGQLPWPGWHGSIPGPQKTKGPVAGALSGAFGVEVYGFEEGMKKKGSL